jgi:chitin synthase
MDSVVLTTSVADPSYGIPKIHILTEVLRYVYLALLVMCFLLAMGNRPQGTTPFLFFFLFRTSRLNGRNIGSKKMFTLAMAGFAVATTYMVFAAIFITVKSIQKLNDQGGITFSSVFSNPGDPLLLFASRAHSIFEDDKD